MTDPVTNIPEKLEKEALLTIQRLLTCTGSVLRDILEEDGIRTGDIDDLDDFEDSEDDESDSGEIGEEEGDSEDEAQGQDEHDNPASPSASRSIQSTIQFGHEVSSSIHQVLPPGRTSVEPGEVIDSAPLSTTSLQSQLLDEPLDHPEYLDLTRRSQFGGTSITDVERLVPETANSSYPDLLRRIVMTARRARFPHKGIFDMSSMLTVLQDADSAETDSSYIRLPNWTQPGVLSTFENLKKIGAAGELYVSAPHSHRLRQFGYPRTVS